MIKLIRYYLFPALLLAGMALSGIAADGDTTDKVFVRRGKCALCGEEYKTRYYQDPQNDRYYCSEMCLRARQVECAGCKKFCDIKAYVSPFTGKSYCSIECLKKVAPTCNVCGRICIENCAVIDNGFFCSEKCLTEAGLGCIRCHQPLTKWTLIDSIYGNLPFCAQCARETECFSCHLPMGTEQLDKARWVCALCQRDMVSDIAQAKNIFFHTQQMLTDGFGMDFDHRITVKMVSEYESKNLPTEKRALQESGAYIYHLEMDDSEVKKMSSGGRIFNIKNEECTIYVLDSLPVDRLYEVFAHELAHDYLQHRYGEFESQMVQEGVPEFFVTQVNHMRGRSDLNNRIATNPDPIYGGGFRLIRDLMEKRKELKGLWKYLERLPRTGKRNTIPGRVHEKDSNKRIFPSDRTGSSQPDLSQKKLII